MGQARDRIIQNSFFQNDRALLLTLWILVFTERVIYTVWDKTGFLLIISDSVNYLQSGLDFAETGRILYNGYPTALIMPGITVLIGLFAKIFTDKTVLNYALRFAWILIGSFTPVFIYKSIRLYTRPWIAFVGSLIYLLPWFVEIDGYLLTECPYYLFSAMAVFFMLRIGEGNAPKRTVWLFALSILGGLLFRANSLSIIAFSVIYWIIKGNMRIRELVTRLGIIGLVLAVFIVPWSLRNYKLFNTFIPITYGASNPIFEGTYQGEGFPTNEELVAINDGFDAKKTVVEKYPEYFDNNGEVIQSEQKQFLDHMMMKELANYRLRKWFSLRPASFLKSYLYIKPRQILNWVWYYIELFGISLQTAHRLRQINFLLCVAAVILSLTLKKHRIAVLFLCICYFINLYMIAFSYAIDRYAQMIMPYRYILAAFCLELFADVIEGKRYRKEESEGHRGTS